MSWGLYRRTLAALFGPFVVVYAALYVVSSVGSRSVPSGSEALVVIVARILVPAVAGTLLFALAARVAVGEIASHRVAPRAAIRSLAPALRDLAACGIASALLAMVAVMLMGPLGILVQPLFVGPPILLQVVAVEGRSFRDASTRTRRLLAGEWARLLAYLFAIALVLGNLVVVAAYGLARAGSGLGAAVEVAVLVALLALPGLLMPFMACAGVVAYVDARVRKEDLAADDLARPPSD